MAAAVEHLAHARLLTLTGPGGVGKTRLALEVARQAAPAWPDGAAWVELASVVDPARVTAAVAAALGIVDEPERNAVDAVAEHCAPRTLLLVLDNCEHMAEACAMLVAALLAQCPDLRVLATSREPLAIAGEVTCGVPPLAVPPVEALQAIAGDGADARMADAVVRAVADAAAVRLFVERAQAALPSFALTVSNAADVAAVVRQLDGLPLAIELAAARVRALTPRQLAARLGNALRLLRAGCRAVPARQQTLEAAVDWSYRLLSEPERALFRRLAVFRDGWTLDAVGYVGADSAGAGDRGCGAGAGPDDALDRLARLVDKSLVVMQEFDGEARYALLEPIRQYAAQRLTEAGEEAAARRTHAEYLADLAEAAAPALVRAARETWEPRLLIEHENLRAALAWAAAQPAASDGAALGARIVAALWPLWAVTTRWRDAHAWAVAALPATANAPDDRPGRALHAAVLVAAGTFGWMVGDPAAMAQLDAGIALGRAQADAPLVVLALGQRGQAAAALGDRPAARAALDEAIAVARRDGSPWLVGAALTAALLGGGWAAASATDMARAAAIQQEAERLWRAEGNRWGLGVVLACASGLACARRDFRAAAAHARESLVAVLPTRDPYYVARVAGALARAAAFGGDAPRAAWLLGAEAGMRGRVGARVLPTQRRAYEATLAAARDALGTAAFARAWADGEQASVEETIAQVLDVAGDARLVAAPETATMPIATRAAPGSTSAAHVGRATGAQPRGQPAALRVRTLGPLVVERGGRLLDSADWGFAKPRELLAYLLCHPEGRTKEQIGLALWPEASASQLRGSFHVAVHHLRRALGDPRWVAFASGRYAFTRAGPCDVDVERFEVIAAEARQRCKAFAMADVGHAADRAATRTAAIAVCADAIAVYGGDFLQGETMGPWVQPRQDALRRIYLDALLALADLQIDAGMLEDALSTYRRALDEDVLWEAAHRGAMRALARLGHRGEARRQYARLADLLRRELDAAPEPETEVVHDRVRRGLDC